MHLPCTSHGLRTTPQRRRRSRRSTRPSTRRLRAWVGGHLLSMVTRVRVGTVSTAARCRATPGRPGRNRADGIDCQLMPGGDFYAARVVGPHNRPFVAVLWEGEEPVGGVPIEFEAPLACVVDVVHQAAVL